MKSFEDRCPTALFVYYAAAICIPVFIFDPRVAGISFAGAYLHLLFYTDRAAIVGKTVRTAAFFCILSAINPIFSHNGATVLFFVNDMRITLEDLLYGMTSAAVILSAVCRFSVFSKITDAERTAYLLRRLSPGLSLLFSMTVRFVPLFREQFRRTSDAQKTLGLYKDGNLIDFFRAKLRIFMSVASWAIENGVTTADSMSARGYGIGRPTFAEHFPMHIGDAVIISLTVAATACVAVGGFGGVFSATFYPTVSLPHDGSLFYTATACCAAISFLPVFYEIGGACRWKYLMSKI